MRLLIFINSLASGGAERVTANLSDYWIASGYDVTIVTMAAQDLDYYELNPKIKRIALNMVSDTKYALVGLCRSLVRVNALRKILKQEKPDVAVGIVTTANIYLGLAAVGLPIHTIGCEHTYPPRHPIGRIWEQLRKYTYGLLDVATALTDEGKVWLEHHTNAKRVITIPNSVTWPLKPIEPKKVPPAIYKTKRKMLLAAGRLEDLKGYDLLIDAFAKLVDKHQDWDLVILGEGAVRSKLEQQIKQLKLSARVTLPGNAGNINDWYETAALYVMTSWYEGFPMTLVEAMAHGVAAVSFDCNTGPRDIIRHNIDGFLIPPQNIEALAEGLDQLMTNDQLREQFSRQALDARDRFSMAKIALLWEAMFDDFKVNAKNKLPNNVFKYLS